MMPYPAKQMNGNSRGNSRNLVYHVDHSFSMSRKVKTVFSHRRVHWGGGKSQDETKLGSFRNSWVMLGEQVVNKNIIDLFGKLGEDLPKVH